MDETFLEEVTDDEFAEEISDDSVQEVSQEILTYNQSELLKYSKELILDSFETVHLQNDINPAMVYLISLSERGRQPQESALKVAANFFSCRLDFPLFSFPWSSIRYQHVVALRSFLQSSYAPATANRILVAVRRVCKEAMLLDQMSADHYAKIASVKQINGSRIKKGKLLEKEDVKEAMALASSKKTVNRDVAIIAVLYGTGLRREELRSLNLSNYQDGCVTVIGKGNKERKVKLTNNAKKLLDQWLEERGKEDGPIFVRAWKGGRFSNNRLSGISIAKIVKEYANCTPHDFRRTYVTNLLSLGIDVFIVSQIVGHENVNTTKSYDIRNESAKIEAIEKLNIANE